jgi:hypothetical protein
VGNWVADEILFHAGLHPSTVASTLTAEQVEQVRQKMLYVCQTAVAVGADSSQFPAGWLMRHRWGKGKKKGEGQEFLLVRIDAGQLARVGEQIADPVFGPLLFLDAQADGTPAVVEFITVRPPRRFNLIGSGSTDARLHALETADRRPNLRVCRRRPAEAGHRSVIGFARKGFAQGDVGDRGDFDDRVTLDWAARLQACQTIHVDLALATAACTKIHIVEPNATGASLVSAQPPRRKPSDRLAQRRPDDLETDRSLPPAVTNTRARHSTLNGSRRGRAQSGTRASRTKKPSRTRSRQSASAHAVDLSQAVVPSGCRLGLCEERRRPWRRLDRRVRGQVK